VVEFKGRMMGNLRESGDDQRGHDGRTVGQESVDGVYLRGAPCCVVVVSRFSGERIGEIANGRRVDVA
jgi:hypothetical protein